MAKKSASTGARSVRSKTALKQGTAPILKKPRVKKQEAAQAKIPKTAVQAKSSSGKPAKPARTTRPARTSKPVKAKTRVGKKSGAVSEFPNEFPAFPHNPSEDPIGDLSDGEGRVYMHGEEPESFAEMAAYRADAADDALEGTLETAAEQTASVLEAQPAASTEPLDEASVVRDPAESASAAASAASSHFEPGAPGDRPVKLDRLQKILSQAGVASRRHAEEMILAGRVMVNGQVITQLGTKADPARDHIKVDGKHIPAAERHRYFLLNKPRGYVTTVSDPEGRPTVMQFFSKMRERLYPVGRLDYDSEGLLLVTNDGELANQLTRAASGVEKTYLVKIAGRPSEEDLDRLRAGVFIERGRPGSEEAQTAPARIRELGHGKSGSPRKGSHAHEENPWFEVVLIEGRNRELRKMFQSIGHFVEKIRRIGYGPLVLDLEPGQMRELTPEELSQLRRAAEGKSQPPGKQRRSGSPRKSEGSRPLERRTGESSRESRREQPRRNQSGPWRDQANFDRRAQGRRDRFPARRDDRNSASQLSFARPFNTGDDRQDRSRRPSSGRGPRFDPRRGGPPREGKPRKENPRQGNPHEGNRGQDCDFSRGPSRSFGASRRDFGRRDSAPRSDWPDRRREGSAAPRGERDRFGSSRGPGKPFGSNREKPTRERPARDPFDRFDSKPRGSRYERSDAAFRPRREDRSSGRPFAKRDSNAPQENPPRRAWNQSPPSSSRPPSQARGFKPGFRRGKPNRNQPRPGGRERP